MWFIADLIERYTNNVAKTFVKLAAREAEANRRALEDLKARRRTHYAGSAEKQLVTPPPIVHPHSGEPVTAADAGTGAVHVPKGFARPQLAEREDPATLLRNRLKSALTELPMGVRGDVIVRYVDLLIGADRHALEETIDRLARVCLGTCSHEDIEANGTVGMRAVEVLDAMYRSFASGRPEKV